MNRFGHRRERGRVEAPAAAEAELPAGVQGALERSPAVQPPVDFAHRVASLAVSQPTRRASLVGGGFARKTAIAVGVLVTVALFLLAARAQASFANLSFDLELVALVQLAWLASWLSTRAGGEG